MKNTHLLLWIMLCFIGGCGGTTSTSSSSQSTLLLGVQAVNGSPSGTSSPSISKKDIISSDVFVNSSIASGAPTSFSLTITKMNLVGKNANGTDISIPIFEPAAGKTIAITGSHVDLSDLFEQFECIDNQGNALSLQTGQSCDCGFDAANNPLGTVTDSNGKEVCPYDVAGYQGGRGSGGKMVALEAAVGTYTALEVVFNRTAKISGCVTGNFGSPESTITGAHTYCTQSAKSFVANTGGGQNADFEDATPEEMDFDLSSPGGSEASGESLTLDFPIESGANLLTPGGTVPLTLVIDTSRMLRFYNQAIVKSINPGAPADVSYFFTSIFSNSIYTFAGQPGSILGYQLTAKNCAGIDSTAVPPAPSNASSDESAYDCASPGVVAAWLTVITDANGNPFVSSFMPDDDNTLTIIKGSNQKLSGGSAIWDDTLINENNDGTFNLGYGLGSDSEIGTVYNINTTTSVGGTLTGVVFRGFNNSYGVIEAIRKL